MNAKGHGGWKRIQDRSRCERKRSGKLGGISRDTLLSGMTQLTVQGCSKRKILLFDYSIMDTFVQIIFFFIHTELGIGTHVSILVWHQKRSAPIASTATSSRTRFLFMIVRDTTIQILLLRRKGTGIYRWRMVRRIYASSSSTKKARSSTRRSGRAAPSIEHCHRIYNINGRKSSKELQLTKQQVRSSMKG